MKQEKIDQIITEFIRKYGQPNSKVSLKEFANEIVAFADQERNRNLFAKVFTKIFHVTLYSAVVWSCGALANWNINPGAWNYWHRELASALGAIGIILILTTEKNEHHAIKKSQSR